MNWQAIGAIDFRADLGCANPSYALENPQCQDGPDNDGEFGTDFDGGESISGVGNGDRTPNASPFWISRKRLRPPDMAAASASSSPSCCRF